MQIKGSFVPCDGGHHVATRFFEGADFTGAKSRRQSEAGAAVKGHRMSILVRDELGEEAALEQLYFVRLRRLAGCPVQRRNEGLRLKHRQQQRALACVARQSFPVGLTPGKGLEQADGVLQAPVPRRDRVVAVSAPAQT